MTIFDKLDDIIYKPIDTICEFISASIERKNIELISDLEIKQKTEIIKTKAGIEREKEQAEYNREKSKMKTQAKIESERKTLETDLSIRRETEVVKIIAELNEWKKDKDFARKKAITDAILDYQRELTKLNMNAVAAIGHMHLDLRERIQEMIFLRMKQFKDLQAEAKKEAMEEYKIVVEEFSDEPEIKLNMIASVNDSLCIIIQNSKSFISEINEDLRSVNNNIDLLARNGQKFIENHLNQFYSLGFSAEEIEQLEDKGKEMI